jgi:hypothetical protein
MCSAAFSQIQHSHPVTISICKQYVAGKGVVLGDLTLRDFSLCMAQIQSLQNCVATPRQKLRRGGGLRKINSYTAKSFSRLLLRRREFALPSLSLILLHVA